MLLVASDMPVMRRDMREPFLHSPVESWRRVLDINVKNGYLEAAK